MSSGMPELGSKISLISKADIRYEGRLFTVDPQECTIALASVRSYGTEDRETQFPVAPQSQVYDYILFRGSDIKDIRVLTNVPAMPNDPAIMQMSVPPALTPGNTAGQYPGQFNHPVIGQAQYAQYHPMTGFPGSVHASLNKTSELSSQTVDLAAQSQPTTAPIGSGVVHHTNQVKDQGSVLDLIGGGSQQTASRSGTPAVSHRKSPTADQGTQQVGSTATGSNQRPNETRRGSAGTQKQQNRNRTSSRNRQRYPSGGAGAQGTTTTPGNANNAGPSASHHQSTAPQQQTHQHHQSGQIYARGFGGWRGRPRGRGRGFVPRNKNTLKFENDYDFEQANTEFEELRSQLAKTKISEGDTKVEGEVEKKDDSGNETGAGEAELDEDPYTGYDKSKSFFDNISCEAIERSKGRSQRTDWRTERKLNSETFGVASARRGAWRGRGTWRQHPQQPVSYFPSWRSRGSGRGRPALHNQHGGQHHQFGGPFNPHAGGGQFNQQGGRRNNNASTSSAPSAVTHPPSGSAAAK